MIKRLREHGTRRGQCRRGFARSSLSTRVIFITLISPLIIVVQRAVTLELEQQSPLYHRRRKRGKRRHGRAPREGERLIDALRFLGSLARCWARHAISRGDARVKREQRAFGVESFPLFRGGEERKRDALRKERQKKTDREKEQTHPPGMQVGG